MVVFKDLKCAEINKMIQSLNVSSVVCKLLCSAIEAIMIDTET